MRLESALRELGEQEVLERLKSVEDHPLSEEPFPWMIRFYLFLGSMVAALFFLGFCFMLLAMESWGLLTATGAGLILVAVWMMLRIRHPFWATAGFVVSATGQLLFLGGLALAPETAFFFPLTEMTRIGMGSLLLALGLYPLVSSNVHRFFVTSLPFFVWGWWLVESGYPSLILEIFWVGLLVLSGWVIWRPLDWVQGRPVALAALLAAAYFAFFIAQGWLARLALTAWVLLLLFPLTNRLYRWPLVVGGALLALGWPLYLSLGVVMVAVAHARAERGGEWMGLGYLGFGLFFYYLSLEWSLAGKGLHLLGSGLGLLGLGLYVNRR